jgi:hypothetical protein
MFVRGFRWEARFDAVDVPGWCFRHGSTHELVYESESFFADISILADGRLTYGAGRLEPIASSREGFNASALAAMAELSNLTVLDAPPAFPLSNFRPEDVDMDDIRRRAARLP